MKRLKRSAPVPERRSDEASVDSGSASTVAVGEGTRRWFARITATQRGSLAAIGVVSGILVAIAASQARLGFGPVGDVLVALLALALFAGGYAVMVHLGARFVRRFVGSPLAAVVGMVLGGAAVLRVVLGVWIVQPVAFGVLGLVGLWGAAIGSALGSAMGSTTGSMPTRSAPLSVWRRWRLLTLAVVASGLTYLVIAYSPREAFSGAEAPERDVASTTLMPKGPLAVQRLRYGSGSDRRREAYRTETSMRSGTVNLSPYFATWTGWRARVHARYWGLTLNQAPLNAEVWLPEGEGPFPVVLLLHRVVAHERSELGFGYLGEQLASRGIVAVAVDANYLNGPWIDAPDGGISARAALLLHHVRFLGEQDAQDTGPLAGRLDMRRIALLGHSRGGESAAAAAMWASLRRNPEFPEEPIEDAPDIRAVVALAPTDGLYRPAGRAVTLRGVNYLLVRGTRDADAPVEAGNGQYQRTLLDSGVAAQKVSVAIAGANHARFNSTGDEQDLPSPLSWLLARDGLLPAEAQRAVTSAAVVTFLSSVLQAGPDAASSVAAATGALAARVGTTVTIRTRDGATAMLAEFDEDVDATTGTAPNVQIGARGFTVWREGRSVRSGNSVVRLEWGGSFAPGGAPVLELDVRTLAGDARTFLSEGGVLSFAVANDGLRTSFTLELESGSGAIVTREIVVDDDAESDGRSMRWRSPLLEESMIESAPPTLHTVEVDLAELYAGTSGFDARSVRAIRFRFDAMPAGRVLLDDIGVRAPRE